MTLVTVSLGDIADDLGSSRATMTWAITGLMLTMAVLTPIAGTLGDLYGHRRLLVIGLAGGTVTIVMCGLAWNAASLIGFRVLFGCFAACVNPNALALMMHAYGSERRATAVGWFQFAATGAPTIGILAGGPLFDAFGWRSVFFVFAAVSALAFAGALRSVRSTPHQAGRRLDLPGAASLGAAVLVGLLTLTQFATNAREADRTLVDVPVIAGVVVTVVAIALFIRIERRSSAPMLRLDYFARRNFTLPMVSGAAMQFAYMGGFVITAPLLEDRYGWTVGAIALLMLPRPGTFSLSSPLGGWLPQRIGMRLPMAIGAVAMILAMLSFAAASPLTGPPGIAWIVAGLVLTGFAAGVSQPAAIALTVDSVDPADVGLANGMNQQVAFIGIVAGVQTMNVLVGDNATVGQFVSTYFVGATAAVISLIAALAVRRGT